MQSIEKKARSGLLYHIYYRKYNTFPACVLIAVVLLALAFVAAKIFIATSYDSYFSFVMGIASFLMAWWTVKTAVHIKGHIKGRVALNAIRRVRTEWTAKKLTHKYLNEEELAEARAATEKAMRKKMFLDEAVVSDIECLHECLQKDKVCATEFLCHVDTLLETLNML